jgi:fumarate reductase subunit D
MAAADEQALLPAAAPGACPRKRNKKMAQQTWDMLLAGLSILLVLTCCPLGLLVAAALSLSSLVLDALCQVVVSCQLDPLYTLFGPLTFGVMRWLRSGAVRHAVCSVHGTAKRFRRLARVLLARGVQALQLQPPRE